MAAPLAWWCVVFTSMLGWNKQLKYAYGYGIFFEELERQYVVRVDWCKMRTSPFTNWYLHQDELSFALKQFKHARHLVCFGRFWRPKCVTMSINAYLIQFRGRKTRGWRDFSKKTWSTTTTTHVQPLLQRMFTSSELSTIGCFRCNFSQWKRLCSGWLVLWQWDMTYILDDYFYDKHNNSRWPFGRSRCVPTLAGIWYVIDSPKLFWYPSGTLNLAWSR